jgi:hypothetical protein
MKPNIQIWDIDRLIPYKLNSKKHDDAQVAKIRKSIDEFGWTQPIVVDKDGSIIAGHGRRLAAISRGDKKVPVWVRDDLSAEQVRALRLADNRVAISQIDTDLMQQELATLDFSMEGFFDAKELNFVMKADLGEVNLDAFVTDLDAEIAAQASETKAQVAATADKGIPIASALGFKTIKGADQRAVAMFMAQIEADTGKTGADAFIEFVSQFAGVA